MQYSCFQFMDAQTWSGLGKTWSKCPVVMQAAQLPRGSMERLLLIAAFAQSGFATGLRPFRNLNAAMGETLEVCINTIAHAQTSPCIMLCAGAKHCSSPEPQHHSTAADPPLHAAFADERIWKCQ